MIIEIFFIITATMCIAVSIGMMAAILGNGVTLAIIIPFTEITPARHFIMYPSIAFQVWFWMTHMGIF